MHPIVKEAHWHLIQEKERKDIAMDLSEIPTEKLLCEMQRRLECQSKPEKRIVLLGANAPIHPESLTDPPAPREVQREICLPMRASMVDPKFSHVAIETATRRLSLAKGTSHANRERSLLGVITSSHRAGHTMSRVIACRTHAFAGSPRLPQRHGAVALACAVRHVVVVEDGRRQRR